jgi:hypothetical protein
LPSSLGSCFSDAPLAQLAEQVTLNHWVVGSIPTRCTLKINDLRLQTCSGDTADDTL